MRIITILMVAWLGSAPAFSSDHIDGPVTTKNGVADISDLYAFPSPNGKGISLVLNVYPFVSSSGHFSSKVSYGVIIRKVDVNTNGARPVFSMSDEVRIDCRFNDDHGPDHSVMCTSSNKLMATTTRDAAASSVDFSLFFGRRSDPFFFDNDWSTRILHEAKLPEPTKSNTMASLNALSIVMEIDRPKLFGGDFGLLAIAAESYKQDSSNIPGVRFDRVGRPEITNVTLLSSKKNDADLRDQYNTEDTTNISEQDAQLYSDRIRQNIKYYDAVDGITDWNEKDANLLVTTFAQDNLIVDISKPCATDAFLEIERSVLAGRPHTTCGGRKLSDDIMDKLYTIYINNEKRAPVGDGVDRPDKSISATFPYLAEPATGLWPWSKAWLANMFLR